MKNKIALMTGVTRQDGAYFREFLLKKSYVVHGIKRRSSLFKTDRIDDIHQAPHVEKRNFFLHYVDATDGPNLVRIIKEVLQPDENYFRPTEVDLLISDTTKAFEKLAWKHEFDLKDLVDDIMKSDLVLMQKESCLEKDGYGILN